MLFFHVGDVPGAISVAFTDVRHIAPVNCEESSSLSGHQL
ncbi:predicted protein [Plenodomus lingam JN3]|uniref:Predicted protein n=1 Tax=Leptosphaeria maculans (strain JN3 / isolate v23.1.3 / race Av1-4-5-6-7-8) TaxID=985895 RepID=E5A4R9_LEPMJ|nr:predicted protein [Plenodomus lingam JN3]CBX98617.1 predicted protein [Plenodomus lingam JN3]